MLTFKISLILCEGVVFGLLAMGVYIAFQWLRFPDLTPDGSFVLGAAVYVKSVILGAPPLFGLAIAVITGALAGSVTAAVNRWVRVPTVVAGLLVASSLYSVTWLLLGKPNQFLARELTLAGDVPSDIGAWRLFFWLAGIATVVVCLLTGFSRTIWGLRARAIGENPRLARDLRSSETRYTFLCLAMANGVVGLAGALFAQRSFSADINMGIGMTITGLAGMILGLLIVGSRRRVWLVLTCVVIGSVLYKAVIFLALEAGLPAEAFRLVAATVLLATFFVVRSSAVDLLKGLKWS